MAESEKEKLQNAEKRLEVEKQIKDIQSDQLNIAFSATESLKTLYNIRTKNSEAERETLKVARNINSALLSQGQSYSKISDIQREISKNQNTITKATKLQNSMEAGMTAQRVGRVKAVGAIQDDILNYQQDIVKLERSKLGASKEDRKIAESDILISKEAIKNLDAQFDKKLKLLSAQEQELLFSKLGSKELEKNNKLREEALDKVKPASQFLQILGAIPGFSNIATEAQSDLLAATEKSISEGGKGLNVAEQLQKSLTAGLEAVTSGVTLAIAAIALLIKNFGALSEASTAIVRQTGRLPENLSVFNTSLVTTVDLLRTQAALTEQLGVNVQLAFTKETLVTASEITKAIGLSADASGNLARLSTITGTNLENSLDALTQSVPKAFSQQKILEETANVSSDIAVSLGSSVNEIGAAVIKANQLGLSLQQVNDIAGSLLDIESSIAAEFEAEVITGKQLNLERARFFALTNDLEGLTGEIANNQEVISSFANATRIEQEAIAGALGMSREQMADMVLKSDLINTLTDKQRANAAGVTLEGLKQLDAQQALADSFAKLAQASKPFIDYFTVFLNQITKFAGFIAAAAAGLATYRAINAAIIAQEKIKLFLAKKQTFQEVAKSAIKMIGNPIALAGGLIAGGLAFAAAKKYATQAGDAIIPAGRGPIISTQEGGLIQGTANDDVVMAPGISNIVNAQRERNINTTVTLSQGDIRALAKAMKDGAMEGSKQGTSQAQINLDGGRVSNRLQPSLAVNTRRYSI